MEKKKLSERIKQNIVKKYEDGVPIKRIAFRYDVGQDEVQAILTERGAKRKMRDVVEYEENTERKQEILKLFADGYKIYQIADMVGTGYYTVKDVIDAEWNKVLKIHDLGKVRALMMAGWDVGKIAEEFRCDEVVAARAMRQVLGKIKQFSKTY